MQGFAEKVAELGSDPILNFKDVVGTGAGPEKVVDKNKVVENKTTTVVSEDVDKSKKAAADAKADE